jgi:hypothetical protein
MSLPDTLAAWGWAWALPLGPASAALLAQASVLASGLASAQAWEQA